MHRDSKLPIFGKKLLFTVWRIDGAYGEYEKVMQTTYEVGEKPMDMIESMFRDIGKGYSVRITPIDKATQVTPFDKR